MATSTTDKDDAKKKETEANKEQIWKDSMGDITAKVDLFYNKYVWKRLEDLNLDCTALPLTCTALHLTSFSFVSA